jgi:hypothetical protein
VAAEAGRHGELAIGVPISDHGYRAIGRRTVHYEVSWPFPEGMSGTPVVLDHHNNVAVAGIVPGIDTVNYGGVAQSVGIVMTAHEIVTLHSESLVGAMAAKLGFEGDEPRRISFILTAAGAATNT